AQEESAKARARMIASLELSNPRLYNHWLACLRSHQGSRLFISASGNYPNSGMGRLNLFRIFVEKGWLLTSKVGRLGMVIQSGLTTNAYERALWTSLVRENAVISIFDFENKRGLFPNVHSSAKFTLLTLGIGNGLIQSACWLHDPSEINQVGRVIEISRTDLELWSPEELSLPQFRSSLDLLLLQCLISGHQAFGNSTDLKHTPRLMFSSSDEAFAPLSESELRAIGASHKTNRAGLLERSISPVYEGKMVGIYDHRQSDIVVNAANRSRKAQEKEISNGEKKDPFRFAVPQHWLCTDAIRKRRFSAKQGDWELVFCDVSSSTNERTCIPCIVPLSGLTRSLPAIYMESNSANDALLVLSVLASSPFDYLVRLKVSANHLTQGILESLPFPSLAKLKTFGTKVGGSDWISDRVLELTYTAWDLEPFASDSGWNGPPFRWDEERRFLLRCELDAAFFHLYLGPQSEWQQQPDVLTRAFPTPRHAVSYIMDTFPIVKRKDEAKHGHYRTKEAILQVYDALGQTMQTGVAYQTRLAPAPASFRVAHRPRLPQETRVPLTQARAYWLEFLVAVARLAGEKLTLEQLWEAYLNALGAGELNAEAQSVLGEDAPAWIASLATEPTEPELFADMLEKLNANGKLHRRKVGDQIFLSLSSDIPAQPDAWRFYDAAAALSIHQARPAAMKIEFAPSKTALRREVARFETLERKFA
ncbi:MAG: hypothetical protein NTY98_05000, partial [Verrucomicrobia bacterium]|nr:hypothetical protein [Verrucomicrobiota bacterium]